MPLPQLVTYCCVRVGFHLQRGKKTNNKGKENKSPWSWVSLPTNSFRKEELPSSSLYLKAFQRVSCLLVSPVNTKQEKVKQAKCYRGDTIMMQLLVASGDHLWWEHYHYLATEKAKQGTCQRLPQLGCTQLGFEFRYSERRTEMFSNPGSDSLPAQGRQIHLGNLADTIPQVCWESWSKVICLHLALWVIVFQGLPRSWHSMAI